jgi:endonuclease YncB( thermonuclease family)
MRRIVKMRTLNLSLLLLFASIYTAIANNSITGKVITVIDGNTMEIQGDDAQAYKVILAGIDCPELTQAFGESAKKHLEKAALNKTVTVNFQGKDRKGNYLAVILVKGDTDLRIDLLKEGLAWTAEKNPDPELENHRARAQEKRKGLWKESNPIPPWAHRREQSMLEAKSS